ncbi:hypothetical protein BWP11_01680 [Aeromonas hydrophila]|nr:hypothetical protein BWP11_01680 [Aeromonas hydrophila]
MNTLLEVEFSIVKYETAWLPINLHLIWSISTNDSLHFIYIKLAINRFKNIQCHTAHPHFFGCVV